MTAGEARGAGEAGEAGEAATGHIVVGVDGSEASVSALRWAARQGGLTGAAVEVVACWEWPSTYGWGMPVPADYHPDADAESALEQLVAGVRAAHPDVAFVPRVVEGHPARVLVELSAGADLLVVGSRGHGEFAGMLLGSVSTHCVAHAHCPVLVMRDDD
ncbi:MAG: universal stress protein [Acidimicrobiales bacterium]